MICDNCKNKKSCPLNINVDGRIIEMCSGKNRDLKNIETITQCIVFDIKNNRQK